MKKLNYILLLFFVAVVASCGDDDDATPMTPLDPEDPAAETPDRPVLTVENPQTGFQGVFKSDETGEVKVNLKGTLDARFSKLEIFKSLDGEEALHEEIEESAANFDAEGALLYEFSYAFEDGDANKAVVFSAVLTDSLEQQSEKVVLVEAEVLLPMVYYEAIVATDFPASGKSQIPYYLRLNANIAEGQRIGTVVTQGSHEEIAMVFSVNEGVGYYLSSPNAIVETDLVIKVNPKAETKFKVVELPEVGFNGYDEDDPFVIRAMFEEAEFGSNEERAPVKVGDGTGIVFKTDSGETGLLHLQSLEPAGGTPETGPSRNELSMRIWLMRGSL